MPPTSPSRTTRAVAPENTVLSPMSLLARAAHEVTQGAAEAAATSPVEAFRPMPSAPVDAGLRRQRSVSTRRPTAQPSLPAHLVASREGLQWSDMSPAEVKRYYERRAELPEAAQPLLKFLDWVSVVVDAQGRVDTGSHSRQEWLDEGLLRLKTYLAVSHDGSSVNVATDLEAALLLTYMEILRGLVSAPIPHYQLAGERQPHPAFTVRQANDYFYAIHQLVSFQLEIEWRGQLDEETLKRVDQTMVGLQPSLNVID